MIGITLERRKFGDLDLFAAVIRKKMAGRILNLISEDFARYIQRSKLSGQVLKARTGETRESVGFYELKQARVKTYVVRPGRNIAGRLNYLEGMGRGMVIAPKKGEFSYIFDEGGNITARFRSAIVRARPFMVPGWKEYKAAGNERRLMLAVYGAYVEREFKGPPREGSV